MPDNVKVDKQGNFYASLVVTKNADFFSTYVDAVGSWPMIRKLIAQLFAAFRMACEYADSVFPHAVLKQLSLSVNINFSLSFHSWSHLSVAPAKSGISLHIASILVLSPT